MEVFPRPPPRRQDGHCETGGKGAVWAVGLIEWHGKSARCMSKMIIFLIGTDTPQ